MQGSAVTIDRVGRLPRHVFERDYVRAGRPVVLEGLVADWPAAGWSLDAWVGRWPERRVSVEERTTGNPFDIGAVRTRSMDLAEFARAVTEPGSASSQRLPFLYLKPRREMPELVAATRAPEIVAGRALEWTLLGGRDPVIPAHYHSNTQVLVCQIHGRKRALLYRPEDTPNLYPYPIHSPHYSMSRVDFLAMDTRAFPRLAAARPVEIFLEPGDVLYLPVHWWHTTFGVGMSFSVTLAWHARLREQWVRGPAVRSALAFAILKAQGRLKRAASWAARRGLFAPAATE